MARETHGYWEIKMPDGSRGAVRLVVELTGSGTSRWELERVGRLRKQRLAAGEDYLLSDGYGETASLLSIMKVQGGSYEFVPKKCSAPVEDVELAREGVDVQVELKLAEAFDDDED